MTPPPASWRRLKAALGSRSPLTLAVERGEVVIRKRHVHGRDVLFQMRDLRSTRDGQHYRAALQHPGERHLAWRNTLRLGETVEQRARLGEIAGGQREPGNEADAVLLAIIQHVLAAAVDEVVAVLDA